MSPYFRYYFSRAIGLAIRPVLFGVMKLLSQRRLLHGMEVWAMADTEDDESLFARISDALDLIRENDSLRFGRLRRHVRRIVVLDGVDALQIPDIGACVLGMRTVLTIPPSRLAATIIHEATHARARAAGVVIEPRTLAREEILCVEEAISFLHNVPGAEEEVTRMRDLLSAELKSDRPWFLAQGRSRK